MKMAVDFVQSGCVMIVLAYLLARADILAPEKYRKSKKGFLIIIVLLFAFISLYGTLIRSFRFSTIHVDTRVLGIALAGIMYGYLPSAIVFVPAAVYTVFASETTMVPDLIMLLVACAFSGFCHNKFPDLDSVLSGIIVGSLEIVHMLLIIIFVHPFDFARSIVYSISFPLIIINGSAAVIFILAVTDVNRGKLLFESEAYTKSEFAVAKNIQRSLLNTDFNADERLDLAAYLEPARDVGGDLYSYIFSENKFFKFIVADVSGKGVPASITMSRCVTLFNEIALHASSADGILNTLNERLCENNRSQMFVTAFVGILNLESGEFIYSNAGHVVPYIVTSGNDAKELPKPKGKALGIFKAESYEQFNVELAPGNYFLTYTDGVTEAENIKREFYGSERLKQTVSVMDSVSADFIVNKVEGSISHFTEGEPQSDDIAIFCFGLK